MDGILLVDKPQGMTSHDVVDIIRKSFGLKKVGHAGTLDPMATGLLVILIGRYTKSSGSLSADDKVYEATLVLGATSDTGDADGKITSSGQGTDFDKAQLEDCFRVFLGETDQVPPMYSAIKFKGRKLYELARRGVSVERKPRRILIKELDILKIDLPNIAFRVACSKGTYIRQLCEDIGKALGCGAYLSQLRRVRSGSFTIDEALGLSELRRIEKYDLAMRLRKA